jgi:hypothetical protein
MEKPQPVNRTNLFFKVEIEHDADERPERIAEEIRQRLIRFYGVREAELSNYSKADE